MGKRTLILGTSQPELGILGLESRPDCWAENSQKDKGVKLPYLHAGTSKKGLATPPSSQDVGTLGHHTPPGKLRPLTKYMSKEVPTCNGVQGGPAELSWTFLPDVMCSTHTPIIVIIIILGLQISLQASAQALRPRGCCRLL